MTVKNQKVITFTEKEMQTLVSARYLLDNIRRELDGATIGKATWNENDFLFATNLLNDLLDDTVCLKLILNEAKKEIINT